MIVLSILPVLSIKGKEGCLFVCLYFICVFSDSEKEK